MPKRRKPIIPPFYRGAPCDEFDLKIMALAEQNPAATDVWIARELDCDKETVGRRRGRPEYRALYLERNLPAREILRNARPLAAKVLVREMTASAGGKPADRISAAKAILGPELVGPESDASQQRAGSIALPGDVAAGLLRHFGSLHGGPVPTTGARPA